VDILQTLREMVGSCYLAMILPEPWAKLTSEIAEQTNGGIKTLHIIGLEPVSVRIRTLVAKGWF
jgi:hypothetical protein